MDPSLRDLERLAETGDLAARSALLTTRLRVGALSLAGLELAAYLGDDAARAALGPSVHGRGPRLGGWAPGELPDDELAWSDMKMWIMGLERWGVPTLVRAFVALGRVAQRELLGTCPWLTSVQRALDLTEAWCKAPGADTAARLQPARDEVAREWEARRPEVYDPRGRLTRAARLHDAAVRPVEVAARVVGGRHGAWIDDWFGGDEGDDPREVCDVPVRILPPAEVER